jgi:hypothetical protein
MKKEKPMKSELAKSEPFCELEKEVHNFRNRLSSLFKHGNGGDSWFREEDAKLAEWSPAVDVSEDDEYLIKADLPEVEKDQVKVTVAEGRISIKGERKHEEEEKKKNTTASNAVTVSTCAPSPFPPTLMRVKLRLNLKTASLRSTCRRVRRKNSPKKRSK